MSDTVAKGGTVTVRMPVPLHRALQDLAHKRRLSLNKLAVGILSAEVCDVKRTKDWPAIRRWQRRELGT